MHQGLRTGTREHRSRQRTLPDVLVPTVARTGPTACEGDLFEDAPLCTGFIFPLF